MREKNKKKNGFKRVILVLLFVLISVFVLIKAENYIKEKTDDQISLIINNNNVTARLKNAVIRENDVIYVSQDDMKNFFDKYIHIEPETNEVVTTYDKKIASIGFESNKMVLNGSTKKTSASCIKRDDKVYLPISEMTDVYNIEIEYTDKYKTVTIDSLNREQTKAYIKSRTLVKWKKDIFSKTIDRISKGDVVIVVSEDDNGWTKIRTQNGEVGYIKTSKLTNYTKVRDNWEEEKQITGKVNMFWDYYSKHVQAKDRTGQTIEGVNVVSPSFFYLDNNGKLQENVGTAGQAYIQWAHSNGYKVWPIVSNTEIDIDTTSKILNSYSKRQELIEAIVEKCAQYEIDGINIDFEKIYEADKDQYSRFIIELVPRMKEIGIVTSVDVTAPDGAPNWSMCYDRNIIGDVADYLIFMGYDQYGQSSTKPGTTAGYNWVETSLKKIIDYDQVPTDKIILGMPLYTRQWTVNQDGGIVSRDVVSMMNIKIPNNVEKQWDDDLKQYYIEYKSGKNTVKMWIEDGTSISAKVSLVTKYQLGGTSCWRKDMETSNIWTIINSELTK